MMRCVSEPISWLLLEQHRLSDLPEAVRQEVQQHLDVCAACKANLAHLDTDTRLLRPLSVSASSKPRMKFLNLGWAAAVSAALIIAAIFLLVLKGGPDKAKQYSIPPSRIEFKGGELAMMLARERDGEVKENPTRFAEEDTFRLFVTHPFHGETKWDVVVWQGNEVYFPFPKRQPIPAGNLVPVPLAFRLTGSTSATICLMIGDSIPSQSELRQKMQKAMPPATVCSKLDPQTPRDF
jgi:hypothetical protein